MSRDMSLSSTFKQCSFRSRHVLTAFQFLIMSASTKTLMALLEKRLKQKARPKHLLVETPIVEQLQKCHISEATQSKRETHFREVSTADSLAYTYHPVPSRTLRFKVKAANDAHIILSGAPNPAEADPVLEIFIGGWSNQKSAIRRDRAKPDKAVVDTPDIVSNGEFRGFWINYLGGAIAVGRENEIEPFMTWTDPAPINVGFFGVCTGHGSSGEWIIDDENYDLEPLRDVVPDAPDMPSASGEVAWVPGQGGVIPPNAVMGGYDNENLYVGRVQHEGAVIPGKVLSSHGVCYVAWGGAEHGKPEYEVLTGSSLQWVPSVEGAVPPTAVVGGTTEDGETLYIGRAQHEGTTTIGKIQPSHKVCYISYAGQELGYPEYEVLVQQ